MSIFFIHNFNFFPPLGLCRLGEQHHSPESPPTLPHQCARNIQLSHLTVIKGCLLHAYNTLMCYVTLVQ